MNIHTLPPRLQLARIPTPIEYLARLTDQLGGPRIYLKRDDLTGSTLSGNKIRKLEFSLAEARRRHSDVIITAGGIQSNHCRATALVCARLGLTCHLVLRGSQEGPPDGNLLLDHLAGARFSFFPREEYSTRRPEIVAELSDDYQRAGRNPYWIPVGASNAIGSWGYIRAFKEISDQISRMGVRIGHIVTAVGSGGTLAGLVAGRALTPEGRPRPRVWGVNVCDDAPTFEGVVRGILADLVREYRLPFDPAQEEVNILDGYVGEGYAIPYPEELEMIRRVARMEGQVFDPVYTGKALHGLACEIAAGRFARGEGVVFIHTGGVYGLFPQRAALGLGG